MGVSFTIPTIYTAIDKFSSPLRGMGRNVEAFASKAEKGLAGANKLFNKLTPSLSLASKEILAFASTAAIAGGIVSGIYFSVDSLKKYEDGVASFRTIVSDLSDKDFAKFQNKINDVAFDTKKSTIEIASSFETISGLNADFAKTADGLGAVTAASVTLAKAAKMELQPAAASTVGIMNQFSLGAMEANRTINVLAAGQAVGAANIQQTADSMVNFGSVASSANITLEQTVGLIQTVGKFSLFGAEAGTKLRGSVLKLQAANMGYASGQFQINDALVEARAKISKISTAKEKDAALTKIFGAENISTGRILLNNIDVFNKYTAGVTGTSEAQKAAEINSKTFSNRLQEMSNKWVNIITTSNEAGSAMSGANDVVVFLTDNMETIVSVGSKLLIFFVAWKALLIASEAAMFAYNVVYGVQNALLKKSIFFTEGNIVAKNADLITTKLMTAANWLFAASTWAVLGPILLVVAAIGAAIAVVVVMIKYWNDWGASLSLLIGLVSAFFSPLIAGLMFVISLVQSFRRNWDMITQAFSEGGVLAGFKAIGATIFDAILMPLQQVLSLIEKFTGADWASSAAKNLEAFRADLGVNVETDESGNPLPGKQLLNPEAQKQESMIQRMEATNNAKVSIDINDPNNRATAKSSGEFVKINLGSTHNFGS